MRLKSLDIFRGLTIVLMLFVNFQDSFPGIYRPFEHSYWDGCTVADMIFPCFLFIVGVTTHLSISARRKRGATDKEIVLHILRRGGILIALGLFLNAFPFMPAERLTHFRFYGVLQRIGAAYIIAALLGLRTTARQQIGIIAGVLVGYWLTMRAYSLDIPTATLAARIDAYVMQGHLPKKGFDSMGILATFPAAMTAMMGMLCGQWLQSGKKLEVQVLGMAGVGSAAIVAGLLWDQVFHINRVLWSSSFTVYTGGIAALTLAICITLVDIFEYTRWGKPFVIFGSNPIAAYVGSTMMMHVLWIVVKIHEGSSEVPAYDFLYRRGFESWLTPQNAAFFFATTAITLWLLLLYPLHRRGIFLRV